MFAATALRARMSAANALGHGVGSRMFAASALYVRMSAANVLGHEVGNIMFATSALCAGMSAANVLGHGVGSIMLAASALHVRMSAANVLARRVCSRMLAATAPSLQINQFIIDASIINARQSIVVRATPRQCKPGCTIRFGRNAQPMTRPWSDSAGGRRASNRCAAGSLRVARGALARHRIHPGMVLAIVFKDSVMARARSASSVSTALLRGKFANSRELSCFMCSSIDLFRASCQVASSMTASS